MSAQMHSMSDNYWTKPKALPQNLASMKYILRMSPAEIRSFIFIAIEYLDDIGGDCDFESGEDMESDGDDEDFSYTEFSSE